ncbi:MAG TPA: hypothetical protein DCL44_00315 [Elusimicrobia bacterium]|nr:hypothetical protein [Elusimicrobiota bacterium]
MKSEVIILVAGRVAQAALTIAGFRLITTFLSPTDVGSNYLIISLATLFGMFLHSPVCMYLNRKLFLWYDSKNIFKHLLAYNIYSLIVAVSAVPIVFVAWKFFGVGAGLPGIVFALIVACYTYVLNWNQIFIPFLNALGYKASFVLLTFATTGLGLFCSVSFVYFSGPSAVAWMSGQVAAIALITVISAYVFRQKVPEPGIPHGGVLQYANKVVFANIAGFAIPLAGAAFFMWAQSQSYRVVVEKINGAEFLGYLAVGFSIATSVAGILESLVQQIYLPGFYRRISGGDKAARHAALAELAAKAIPVYIIYLFFIIGSAEYLVSFLVAERYRSVFVYARYGAFMEFFRMTANILASAAHSEMRTQVLVKPYFFGGITAIVGVYLAALSSHPSALIPSVLAVSGLITVAVMWRVTNSMFSLASDPKPFISVLLLSLLFLPLAFFHVHGFLLSLGVLLVSGSYFIFLQYKVAGKWFDSPKANFNGGLEFAHDENLIRAKQEL